MKFAYAALILLIGLASELWIPSAGVVPREAAVSEFSAERAYDHLKVFAVQPRVPGTANHDEAAEYIAETIRRMGIPVSFETSTADFGNRKQPIRNIVAELPGTQPGKPILMTAHYDSVEEGPGANDDAANVAVLLELLRVLKQEAPLRNSVVVLLTDGEESGLFGAKAYMKSHTADDIGFVLNLEARGSSGPMLLFQTSGENGQAIRLLRENADHPYAFSFFQDVFKILPNDTDFTVFKNEGVPGLNFAYAEGASVYHTANDDLGHVSLPTVQHSGETALAMAQTLGNADLSSLNSQGNDAFFNLFGNALVTYPAAWNPVLTATALALSAWAVYLGWKRRELRLRHSVKWVLFSIVVILLLAVFGTFWSIGYSLLEFQGFTWPFFVYVGIVAILSGLIVWGLRKIKAVRRLNMQLNGMRTEDAAVGAMLLMALLALLTTFGMPGSHYLTAIPLSLSAVSLGGSVLLRRSPWAITSLQMVTVIPLILVLYPFFRLMAIGVGIAGIHYLLILLLLFVPLAMPLARKKT